MHAVYALAGYERRVWFFLACTLHLGVPPHSNWWVEEILVPSPEPGLEEELRASVTRSLGSLNALGGEGARPVILRVEEAEWRPLIRGGGELEYEAILSLRVEAGSLSRRFSSRTGSLGVRSAEEARNARASSFSLLSSRLSEEVALWLSGLP